MAMGGPGDFSDLRIEARRPAWIRMTKKERARLESTQKEYLYELLELLPTVKYVAVLLEMGLPRVKHYMNQLKINYMSALVNNKSDGQTLRLLEEEEKLYPGSGLLAKVHELCEKYKLPNVTTVPVLPDQVKDVVSWTGMFEAWKEC